MFVVLQLFATVGWVTSWSQWNVI